MGGKTIMLGINRSADYSGKLGINDHLPGNDQKNLVILWIAF